MNIQQSSLATINKWFLLLVSVGRHCCRLFIIFVPWTVHYGKLKGTRRTFILGAKLAFLWKFLAFLTRMRVIETYISPNFPWGRQEILEMASGEQAGGVLLVSRSALNTCSGHHIHITHIAGTWPGAPSAWEWPLSRFCDGAHVDAPDTSWSWSTTVIRKKSSPIFVHNFKAFLEISWIVQNACY